MRVTTERQKKLNARLQTFTLEQILEALENLHRNPFYRGENDRGWVADPMYLIKNDSQVDKWINTKPKTFDQKMEEYVRNLS